MSSLSDAPRPPRAVRGPNPRRLLIFGLPALALVALVVFLAGSFGQVKPGYVGLMINQYGSGAGVSSRVLGVGTYFTPPGTTIQAFPVFTQNYTYSASANEGGTLRHPLIFHVKEKA